MTNEKLLSVIVPAYRKAGSIEQAIKNIEDVLKQIRYDYEIIVVTDGRYDSDDKTFEEAQKLASQKMKVFGYRTNQGKGYAVRYGMSRSTGNPVAFIDAGMKISPNSLSLALEHLEWYNADVIVGSKRHPASKVQLSLPRKITSFVYQVLVWVLFRLKVGDTQVGIKIFRRAVLEDVLPRLLVKRYAFDIEILAVANSLGYKRIFESPVEMNATLPSLTSPATLKEIFYMLRDTLAVFYRLNIRRYYSDKNKHRWQYDPELDFKVNVP